MHLNLSGSQAEVIHLRWKSLLRSVVQKFLELNVFLKAASAFFLFFFFVTMKQIINLQLFPLYCKMCFLILESMSQHITGKPVFFFLLFFKADFIHHHKRSNPILISCLIPHSELHYTALSLPLQSSY